MHEYGLWETKLAMFFYLLRFTLLSNISTDFSQPRYNFACEGNRKPNKNYEQEGVCFQPLKYLLLLLHALPYFHSWRKKNTLAESLAFSEKHLHYEENSPALHPDEV